MIRRDTKKAMLSMASGENRIRTCEPVLPVTRFPGVPLQPLEHLSRKIAVANVHKKMQIAIKKRLI